MSAFICSDLHIATIARAIFSDDLSNAQELANKLKAINIESVNFRYGEKTRKTKCSINEFQVLTPNDVLNLIQCWEYQSCEHDSIEHFIYSRFLCQWIEQHGALSGNSKLWSI